MTMTDPTQIDHLVDYITGNTVPNRGAETHRQKVERFLVENKGYAKTDLRVDFPLDLDLDGQIYHAAIDLVVCINDRPLMVVKCAAASLASCEREVCSAARLLTGGPSRFAVVSDGQTAIVWDVWTREQIGTGLTAIPDRSNALQADHTDQKPTLTENQKRREKLIFRTYDMANVHRAV